MKKTVVKTAPTSTLPAGFSSEETPPSATPVPEPVPEIAPDATLKVETVTVTEEPLPEQEKKSQLWFVIGSLTSLAILVGSIVFSAYYFSSPTTQTAVVTPSITPTTSVTPTAPPALANSAISFEVLNATKTSGLAGQYGKKLEAKGYKVAKLGNSEDTVTGIAVYISSTLDSQKEKLMADLKAEFPNAVLVGPLTGSDNLVRFIIGD